MLRCKLFGKSYEFRDLRELMGKANEEKSGDRLAGLAANSAIERAAARYVLSQVTLEALRASPAVPYAQDEETRVIDMSYKVITDWKIPTQNCVLSHVTTQMEALKKGSPIGLVFQSIAGSQKGNESFGISVGMLDEALALAQKHSVAQGPNYMYF